MAKIDELFKIQKERKGSDLHLSPGYPPLCRISGEMVPIREELLTHDENKAMVYEIMTPAQIENFEKTHDLDFAYANEYARFRANIFKGRLGVSAVFRMIPSDILSAEMLGLPDAVLKLTHNKRGLVLVTGATGSGKSTTLAAMVDYINKTRQEHILTVEDPIEFVHQPKKSLVNHREVGAHTKSFATALRAALREDPDIILLGEMRDLETIEMAITAAETGHLVFGTLHTSSAAKTVDRIINVFPTNQQAQIRSGLAESLRGVIAQNLLRTVDGKRVAALEIMIVNTAISNLIREGKTFQIPSTIQMGKREGSILMDDAIKQLLMDKKITKEEAIRFAVDKATFEAMAG